MKKILLFISFFTSVSVCYSQDDLKIWTEFLQLVRNNQMTVDRIKPIDQLGDGFKPILLSYLDTIRVQASAGDWTYPPEIIRNNDRIQFIVPWSGRGQKLDYCFSFVIVDKQWYFQHLESIFIRLDKIPAPPVSTFPDVSEAQKEWAREEMFWSFIVQNIYLPVSSEKGKEYALDLLKDGAGYFLAARAWVPFTSPAKAFILYLCWEQSNLRGNKVILESLTDTRATVSMQTIYFYLYFIAGHLKTRISLDDYKQIFETIWQDRAGNAGWDLDIKYSPDYKVTFEFNYDK